MKLSPIKRMKMLKQWGKDSEITEEPIVYGPGNQKMVQPGALKGMIWKDRRWEPSMSTLI